MHYVCGACQPRRARLAANAASCVSHPLRLRVSAVHKQMPEASLPLSTDWRPQHRQMLSFFFTPLFVTSSWVGR